MRQKEIYIKKNGIDIDELIANQMVLEEELPEDLGYGTGKTYDADPEDEEDEIEVSKINRDP